jgi:hypothetical protein
MIVDEHFETADRDARLLLSRGAAGDWWHVNRHRRWRRGFSDYQPPWLIDAFDARDRRGLG